MGKIVVCDKCLNPKCAGKNYKIIDKVAYHPEKICSSEVYKRNGKFYYKYVMGHGCEFVVEVKEI